MNVKIGYCQINDIPNVIAINMDVNRENMDIYIYLETMIFLPKNHDIHRSKVEKKIIKHSKFKLLLTLLIIKYLSIIMSN